MFIVVSLTGGGNFGSIEKHNMCEFPKRKTKQKESIKTVKFPFLNNSKEIMYFLIIHKEIKSQLIDKVHNSGVISFSSLRLVSTPSLGVRPLPAQDTLLKS